MRWLLTSLLFAGMGAHELCAQTSSLYRKAVQQRRVQAEQAQAKPSRHENVEEFRRHALNPQLERVSLIAIETKPPHEYQVHDLLTVIVREQKTYQSDAKLESEHDYRIESKINEFFRTLNGHLAAASFTDGMPNIDYEYKTELEGEGDFERNDRLTFRLTVEVIDIKPNGRLVLASGPETSILVDGEVQRLSFTGECRNTDITADNTILSTQIFNQVIELEHAGAVRDAAKRGWLLRILDFASPF